MEVDGIRVSDLNAKRVLVGAAKIVIAALVLVVLFLISCYKYLVFHGLVESFSIIISSCVFVIAWITRKRDDGNIFTLLGIGYLFVGVLDFFHMLSYQDMPMFSPGLYTANQLWICARSMEGATLLIFALLVDKKVTIKGNMPFLIFSAITGLLLASVFYFQVFPICFVAGKGQTAFKIVAEYVICAILALAALVLYLKRNAINAHILDYFIPSLIVTILSELSFTLYADNFGLLNMVGHLLKVIAFYLIYQSIIQHNIENPLALLFSNLRTKIAETERLAGEVRQSEAKYRALSEEMEAILDHIPGPVFYKDRNNRFVRVNKYLADAHETAKGGLEGASLYDLYTEEEAARYHRDDLEVIASGRPKLNIVEPWVTHAGRKWVLTSKLPFVSHEGQVLGVMGVSVDVTERKEAEDALQRSEARLRELNATKDKFFSIIAHDLINPLSGLRDIAKLMVESFDTFTEAELKNILRLMWDSSSTVYSLMENLLAWSRGQQDLIRVDITRLDASMVADEVVGVARLSADKKNIEITHDIPRNSEIESDKDLLTLILRNFLSNAIKFTPEGGRVELGMAESEGETSIFVKDNGQGIKAEILDRLFKIGSSVPTEGTAHERGTGLGLILCWEFVEKLGGRISVESEVGKGSTFSVFLKRS